MLLQVQALADPPVGDCGKPVVALGVKLQCTQQHALHASLSQARSLSSSRFVTTHQFNVEKRFDSKVGIHVARVVARVGPKNFSRFD